MRPAKINLTLTVLLSLFFWTASFSQPTGADQKKQAQMLQLARSLERNARFEEALDIYRRLWQEQPLNIDFYRGVKNSLEKLNNLTGAEAAVKKMLEYNSSEIVEVDLGDIYYKMGAEKQAYLVWQGIIQKSPKKLSAYQLVAAAMTRNNLYEEAIKIYQQGQKALGRKDVFLIEMANLYRAQMNYQEAVQLYLDYLEIFPEQYNFIELNVTSLSADDDFRQEIEKIIRGRIAQHKDSLALRNILAAFYIRSSNYRSALDEYAIIDQYVSSRPEKEKEKLGHELFRFAQDAFNDEMFDYALQAFQLVINRYPDSDFFPEAKIGMGMCYNEQGDYPQALVILDEVVRAFPKSAYAKTCALLMGEIQLEKLADAVSAEKYFREALGIPPFNNQNYEALFRIGDSYLQRDFLDKARGWYDQILHQKSINNSLKMKALLKMGKVYYWQGDMDRATEYFKKIQTDPVIITNKDEGFYVNDALERQLLIDEGKESPEMLKKLAATELLIEQKKYSAAQQMLDEILANHNSHPLVDDALIKAGELAVLTQNFEAAIGFYRRVVLQPETSCFVDFAQKKIGDIYYQNLKDSTRAISAYETVLANYPDSIYLEEVRDKIRLLEKK